VLLHNFPQEAMLTAVVDVAVAVVKAVVVVVVVVDGKFQLFPYYNGYNHYCYHK